MRNMTAVYPLIFLVLVATYSGCQKEQDVIPFEPFSWETSTPGAQGMDAQLLDSAFILASEYGFVDGLLIIRNSKIVAEAYFNGFTADQPHNIMSVSKSILSACARPAKQKIPTNTHNNSIFLLFIAYNQPFCRYICLCTIVTY